MNRFGSWRYDERTGMVAVYSGDELNCLDLPSDSFIYMRKWERKAEGLGFEIIEEDCAIGRLVAAAPDMRNALEAAAKALLFTDEEIGVKALKIVLAAIAKADGRDCQSNKNEAGLREAVGRAAEELSENALASPEEKILISNAMSRALQVILNYQQERQSTKR